MGVTGLYKAQQGQTPPPDELSVIDTKRHGWLRPPRLLHSLTVTGQYELSHYIRGGLIKKKIEDISTGQHCQVDRQEAKGINITCILLIPTNSDRWMKAFRGMTSPCIRPNSEEIYLSPKDAFLFLPNDCCRIQNADLQYLQSLQWCSVQNREIKSYKAFFRKKKRRNIKHLSIKKENIEWSS